MHIRRKQVDLHNKLKKRVEVMNRDELIDETRALPYEAIRYVPGYPEQYVKEYAAACTKELREALKRLAEVYDAMGNPRGPALIAAEAALAASPVVAEAPVPKPDTGSQEDMVQRMKDAIEGECDGLAIDDGHAKAILEYVLASSPPQSAPQEAQPVDVMRQALEAVLAHHLDGSQYWLPLVKAALSAPQASQSAPGEAVAWLYSHPESCANGIPSITREPSILTVSGWTETPLYTHPATTHSAPSTAEAALRKVLHAVQKYLPPDGTPINEAMSEIISVVDPWPLDSAPVAGMTLTDDEIRAIEAALREKAGGKA